VAFLLLRLLLTKMFDPLQLFVYKILLIDGLLACRM
jgi:hypothetical protein